MQDVVQFKPLGQTLLGQMVSDPQLVPAILRHVGFGPIADWTRHFTMLAIYSALYSMGTPFLQNLEGNLAPKQRYRIRRWVDAWEYGSGRDYHL